MSRKNIEDLITAFLRQKFRHRGIQDYEFEFKWTDFIDDVQITIKRVRNTYKGTIAQEEIQIATNNRT